jgi:integrase
MRALSKHGTDEAIAADLVLRSKTLSKSTVRQYRSAYSHVWDLRGRDDLIEVVQDCIGERQAVLRTSAKKLKAFRHEDLMKLLESLVKAGEMLAAAWLRCGYVTGLRPCEWQRARLVGNRLVVQNAKATNGRAHSDERIVLISDFRELHNIDALCHQLAGQDFEKKRRHVARAIGKHAKSLWPRAKKLPTLYSARHGFSAEAKAIFSREEVAALMGHASTETAGRHYARRRIARGFLKVRPTAADVAAVISISKKPVGGVPKLCR